MIMQFKSLLFSSALIALVISGCDGGSNSVSGIDGSGAPAVAGTVSTGAINGFGSVIVNGVHYNSDRATVLINGQVASEDNLRAGYQVKITGKINKGTSLADTIEFYANLIGPITQIDYSAQELTLLNHRVRITNTTLFDAAIKPNLLSGLKQGDLVSVSGFADDQEAITATRIELTTAANHQVMGKVSDLNAGMFTFAVGNQKVNFSGASLSSFASNQVAENNVVVVSGTVDDKDVLQAKTVTKINHSMDKDVKRVETEGFITRFVSANDFDVAGVTWDISAQTLFEDGNSANLARGSEVSIKGELTASGQLIAQKIEFKKVALNAIAGEVTSVSVQNTDTVMTGTIQIGSTGIQTNAQTMFEDKGLSSLKRFNVGNINVGDFLKISGYTNQGIFVATKIEREDIQKETVLKVSGIATGFDEHSFMLYGRMVTTNSSTRIKDNNGKEITEAQFYLQAMGKRVSVEGTLKGPLFTASNINITTEI